MSKIVLVLGNQLFPYKYYKNFKDVEFVMIESWDLCTHFRYHKHKLVLFLTSMRKFAQDLRSKGIKVDYYSIDCGTHNRFCETLKKKIKKDNITEIISYEVEDLFFQKELRTFLLKNKVNCEFMQTPLFLSNDRNFKEYMKGKEKPFMKTFYEHERKRLGVLLDDQNKPLGGKWSFDSENRKKTPKDYVQPPRLEFCKESKEDEILNEVKALIEKNYPKHPGTTENFWYPTERKQVLKLLDDFIKNKLQDFGPYQDAIDKDISNGNHSLISANMNMGLITPQDILDRIAKIDITPKNIASVEGFLRQVIGWREFIRHIYRRYEKQIYTSNFFNHRRRLNKDIWYGREKSGIPILDDAIEKALENSYSHHIERLMIFSNIMLLCRVHPREVYKWFMEMFSDSSDWVMAPNVFCMGQFSDGGIFATKPYFCGSNYYLKMSHYKKGDWTDGLDGLYWKFIDDNREFFKTNHRMSFMVSSVDKMDDEKKYRIYSAATELMEKLTLEP